MLIKNLKEKAKNIRINCIKSIIKSGSGHPGGSLSIIDLITVLFFSKIKRCKENALIKNRDRFILSKGHAVPALYSLFAEIGIINQVELFTLRQLGSKLQGHPDKTKFPEVEASTGSLGQGLSIAQGMALSYKLDSINKNIYCLLGDGEIQEGQVWEAFMSAPKYNLDNLCAIIDCNKSQIDGNVKDVMNIEPLSEKIKAFNWNVIEIDGHNVKEIINAYDIADNYKNKPSCIIANTVKGKGVSFMEDNINWHGKAPDDLMGEKAIAELSSIIYD